MDRGSKHDEEKIANPDNQLVLSSMKRNLFHCSNQMCMPDDHSLKRRLVLFDFRKSEHDIVEKKIVNPDPLSELILSPMKESVITLRKMQHRKDLEAQLKDDKMRVE